jgi:hypothetical protein
MVKKCKHKKLEVFMGKVICKKCRLIIKENVFLNEENGGKTRWQQH